MRLLTSSNIRAAVFSALLLCTALICAAPPANSPLAINGRLSVDGNKMVNEVGDHIQLRGVSFHGMQWFFDFYSGGDAVRTVASQWGADLIRIPQYIQEQGYLEGGSDSSITKEAFRNLMDELVATAEEAGIYAIIDWHVHRPGNPNLTIDEAKLYWEYMSNKHKDKKNVLYEICNEPSAATTGTNIGEYTTWDMIKTYANVIIPIIRANDPNAIIIVGTPSWSTFGLSSQGSTTDITNSLLTQYSNIMYTLHFYAVGHTFKDQIDAAAKVAPIICTEWGSSGWQETDVLNVAAGQPWVDMMAANKISWGYWNFAPGTGPFCMIPEGGSATTGPGGATVTGAQVYAWMNQPADDFGIGLETPTTLYRPMKNLTIQYDRRSSMLTVSGMNEAPGMLSIFNSSGRQVLSLQSRNSPNGDMRYFAPISEKGVYLIRMGDPQSAAVRKVLLGN